MSQPSLSRAPNLTACQEPVSRSEGYRLGVPKEAAGIEMARDYFASTWGAGVMEILGAEDNYRQGDLRLSLTVEVKRQPIDPERYERNFVEVFEETDNPRHEGGLDELAQLLGMPVAALERATVRDHRDQTTKWLGKLPRVSVSVRSMMTAAFTVYVNPENGWLALYTRSELLNLLRHAIWEQGFVRGAGRSNADTFAVYVPYPLCLRRLVEGRWVNPRVNLRRGELCGG